MAAALPAHPHAPAGDWPRVIRSSFLSGPGTDQHLHLIVLNFTLPKLTAKLWHIARTRVCADGGANRLYDELPRLLGAAGGPAAAAARARYVPDLITGDLDSVRPEVLAYYTGRGASLADLSHDQDTTDLQKCVRYVEEVAGVAAASSGGGDRDGGDRRSGGGAAGAGSSPGEGGARGGGSDGAGGGAGSHLVLVLGALGGRLDHTLSNLATLYKFPHLHIALVGDGNVVRLLPAGSCSIVPDRRAEGPTCALVPLAAPATASSTGLRWNVDNTYMCFRGLISTSNVIQDDVITVTSDEQLLWITEFREEEEEEGESQVEGMYP